MSKIDASARRSWAVVTGASAGLGKAFARILASWNHSLVLVARRAELLESLKADLLQECKGIEVHCLALDLNGLSAPRALADFCRDHQIEPAMLVNNAGHGDWSPFLESDADRLASMIDVNCRALALVCREVVPLMPRGGRVLNVASLAGFMPGPNMAVYYASKAFVLSLSQALDHEFKPLKIRVSALCPGPVNTEFLEISRLSGAKALKNFRLPGPYEVALKGLEKCRGGKRIVVYGLLNRLMVFCLRLVPRWVPVRAVAGIQHHQGAAAGPVAGDGRQPPGA